MQAWWLEVQWPLCICLPQVLMLGTVSYETKGASANFDALCIAGRRAVWAMLSRCTEQNNRNNNNNNNSVNVLSFSTLVPHPNLLIWIVRSFYALPKCPGAANAQGCV